MSTFAIIIERAEDGGYGAWSPDLPGCVALGDSEAEALSEMAVDTGPVPPAAPSQST